MIYYNHSKGKGKGKMESKHFYKVEATYERLEKWCNTYFPIRVVMAQEADTEEEAVERALMHLKFDHCASDTPLRNYQGKILEKIY